MNFKSITAPLTEKIGALTGLIQEIETDIKALVEINNKQFLEFQGINRNLVELIDIINDKNNICKTEKDTH